MEKNWWHHQLTHLHIYSDCSRNVLWKLWNCTISCFIFNLKMLIFTFAQFIISPNEYRQLRARSTLSTLNDVPLRTRRALTLYNVYGDSALLALNWCSFVYYDNIFFDSSCDVYLCVLYCKVNVCLVPCWKACILGLMCIHTYFITLLDI